MHFGPGLPNRQLFDAETLLFGTDFFKCFLRWRWWSMDIVDRRVFSYNLAILFNDDDFFRLFDEVILYCIE